MVHDPEIMMKLQNTPLIFTHLAHKHRLKNASKLPRQPFYIVEYSISDSVNSPITYTRLKITDLDNEYYWFLDFADVKLTDIVQVATGAAKVLFGGTGEI